MSHLSIRLNLPPLLGLLAVHQGEEERDNSVYGAASHAWPGLPQLPGTLGQLAGFTLKEICV